MNLEDGVYDLRYLYKQLGDDSRFDDLYLIHKINNYRSRFINEAFSISRMVDPVWIQDTGVFEFTCVTSDDDPTIPDSTLKLGKFTLPPVVSLEEDAGHYRISSATKFEQIYRTTIHKLYDMINAADMMVEKFLQYYAIGDVIYTYPFIPKGSAQLILDNPLDGFKLTTEKIFSGGLVVGKSYTVKGFEITYDGTPYSPGAVFTATTSGGVTFTSELGGFVLDNNPKVQLDMRERYPCDRAMFESIVMSILTIDFGFEYQIASDIKSDHQDQLRILKQNG